MDYGMEVVAVVVVVLCMNILAEKIPTIGALEVKINIQSAYSYYIHEVSNKPWNLWSWLPCDITIGSCD